MSFERAIADLKALLGPAGWRDGEALAPLLVDHTGQYRGQALLATFPESTVQVAQVVTLCAAAGIAIVPQGGNTGLCAAAVPENEHAILLRLDRMNRVRRLDAPSWTMTVEAGCILADVQKAAAEARRFFPLSLGSEGSCRIGGNIGTNAGGTQVLRYGNMRDLTLGLEVVLADGTVWNGLKALRKDNTGYDLKHLFVGSEGTLGIVTAASLRLYPAIEDNAAAFVGVDDPEAAMRLLDLARRESSDNLIAFELMSQHAVSTAVEKGVRVADPLATQHPWYVLMEVASADAADTLERTLSQAFEDGLVRDAALSRHAADITSFWRLREAIVEVQNHYGKSLKQDISVPLAAIPAFLDRADAAIRALLPGAEPLLFGHCGDGNIHCNVSQCAASAEEFERAADKVIDAIYGIVADLEGSISAEHGIGMKKRAANARYGDPVALSMMREIKRALDPKNLMNPGKIFDLPPKTHANREAAA